MDSKKALELLTAGEYDKLASMLKEDISISTSVNRNVTKNIIALSKAVAKDMTKDGRPALAGAFMRNGRQCILNGYYLATFTNITQGVVEIPDEYKDQPTINVEYIMANCREHAEYEHDTIELDLKDIKSKYNIWKSTTPKDNQQRNTHMRIQGRLFDVRFVLQLVPCFENARVQVVIDRNDCHTLYVKGDNGDGILMGIREISGKTDDKYLVAEVN